MKCYILQSWDRWGVDTVLESVWLNKEAADAECERKNEAQKIPGTQDRAPDYWSYGVVECEFHGECES
jgi:hypothetical protein